MPIDNNPFEEHKILIWGKTYPELSVKYYETVCTGGVLNNGKFIRLYPIPFRYLTENQTFSRYQWITARIRKSREDRRPESYKIDPESIVPGEIVPSDKFNWHIRSGIILKNPEYQFASMEALMTENKINKTSMGFVRPAAIENVILDPRPKKDLNTFIRKMSENKAKRLQKELFEIGVDGNLKNLQFLTNRFKVKWYCNDQKCSGHLTSILDWEVYELARKVGNEKTLVYIKEKLNLNKFNIGFFMGNLKAYPNRFAIGGIWYPQKSNLAYQGKLEI